MKNFEEILKDGYVIRQDGAVLIGGFGRRRQPPTPHEPYETPEGALYVGYVVKGKEYLYTEEELTMFNSLEGVYTNIPADDPYATSPPYPINIGIEEDLRDQTSYTNNQYELTKLNDTYSKPNFSSFKITVFPQL